MTRNWLEYHLSKGVKVVTSMPKGWKINEGATTAPIGYTWVYNGKSLFSKERKTALLKIN